MKKGLVFNVLLLSITLTTTVHAELLTNIVPAKCATLSSCSIEGGTLSGSATVSVSGRPASQVSFAGAGIRLKKIALFKVKVYVAELLLTDPKKFNRNPDLALASLDSQPVVAMHLHFLRNVEAAKVMESFQDALSANDVDLTQPAISQFLEIVSKSGEAKNDHNMTFLGEKISDGSEIISFEDTSGTTTTLASAPQGTMSKIMSMWLGSPSDKELGETKKDLLLDRGLLN